MRHLPLAFILSALALTGAAQAQTPPGLPDGPHVVVVGTGTAEAAPDHLVLTLSIRVLREDAGAAKADVDARSEAVLAALGEIGLDEENLTVSPVSVSTEYNHDQEPLTPQYAASRSVDVLLRDFSLFDAIVQRALAAGVTDLYRPDVRAKDHDQLAQEAQARAIADAKARARSLATQFGAALGPIYSVTTADARSWSSRNTIWGSPATSRALLSFEPKPVSIRQQVYAVFALGEPLAP